MRTLVDEYIGKYRDRVQVILSDEPIREISIFFNAHNITFEEAILVGSLISAASEFVKTDPDPWNNPYGQN
jgi:hypothetical protein